MEMVAHDPSASRRTGVPRSVAEDFTEADRRNKGWKRKEHSAKATGASAEIAALLAKA
jgi:hypothetical protein